MLYQEWKDATNAVADERGINPMSDRLARNLYPLACAIYVKRRLDAVAVGPERHVRLVRWMLDNDTLCMRYRRFANSIRMQEIRAVDDRVRKISAYRAELVSRLV